MFNRVKTGYFCFILKKKASIFACPSKGLVLQNESTRPCQKPFNFLLYIQAYIQLKTCPRTPVSLPCSNAVKRTITFHYMLKKCCCAINVHLCKLSAVASHLLLRVMPPGLSMPTGLLQSFGGLWASKRFKVCPATCCKGHCTVLPIPDHPFCGLVFEGETCSHDLCKLSPSPEGLGVGALHRAITALKLTRLFALAAII